MRYQNAYSENTVLLVIALVTMVVFILLLFAAFVIARSERRTKKGVGFKDEPESSSVAVRNATPLPEERAKNEAGPEKEHKSSLTAGGHARFFSQDKPKGELNSRQKVILESLKTLNWMACCIIAAFVAFSGYDRLQYMRFLLFPISSYYYWSANILAIISPACIAVAWLRLTGVEWRQALLAFLFVPVGVFVIWYMFNILPYMIAN